MLLSRIVAAFLLVVFAAFGQPFFGAPNITASHIHLNVADPAAAAKFFSDVLGTSASSRGSFSGVSTLGVTILFTRATPSGPSAGSAIDHIAFRVPDFQPVVERLAGTGYKAFHPETLPDHLMIDGPGGVRIELIEDTPMYAPLEFNHIHLNSPQPKEMEAWYAKNFGVRRGFGGDTESLQLGGLSLEISPADSVAPTAGRAIDHLSFEVKDLAAFCKKLADNGVKLEVAPHPFPELNANQALLTDPWGTRIELFEKNH